MKIIKNLGLLGLSIICFCSYMHFGYIVMEFFGSAWGEEDPITGFLCMVYMFGSFAYAGLMGWRLIKIVCDGENSSLFIKEAITIALIFPIMIIAGICFGTLYLLAVIIFIGLFR